MATAHVRVDGDAVAGVGDITEIHVALPGELAEQGDPYARHRCTHCGNALRHDHEGTFVDSFGKSECADDPASECRCEDPDCGWPVGTHRREPAPLAWAHSIEVEADDPGDALEIRIRVDGEAKPIVTRIWRNPHGGLWIGLDNVPPTMWVPFGGY